MKEIQHKNLDFNYYNIYNALKGLKCGLLINSQELFCEWYKFLAICVRYSAHLTKM